MKEKLIAAGIAAGTVVAVVAGLYAQERGIDPLNPIKPILGIPTPDARPSQPVIIEEKPKTHSPEEIGKECLPIDKGMQCGKVKVVVTPPIKGDFFTVNIGGTLYKVPKTNSEVTQPTTDPKCPQIIFKTDEQSHLRGFCLQTP